MSAGPMAVTSPIGPAEAKPSTLPESLKEKRIMRQLARACAAKGAGIVSLLMLTGCLSTHPGSSSLAYVDIESHGPAAVQAETLRVFTDDGYELVRESGAMLAFEREATQRDRVLYGRYGEDLAMRVVVLIEPRRQGGSLVRADAYVLRGSFEDRVPRVGRRPYQDLLNRVKANFVRADSDA